MTKLTVSVPDNNKEFTLSDAEIRDLVKTRQDYIEGKTTARDWKDVEEDLNCVFK